MKKLLTSILALSFVSAGAAEPPKAIFPKKHQAFLNKYCLDCHDTDTEKGEVNLEELPFHIDSISQAELWQSVLGTINSGEMPPEDKKQPSDTEKASFLEDLSNTMVTARRVLSDSGGKITMRRLNKRDYQNSIEHLVGVRLDDESLPDDGASGDFDTVGASLFISGDKFELYMKTASLAIDELYKRQDASGHSSKIYRIEPEHEANKRHRDFIQSTEKEYERFNLIKKDIDAILAKPEHKELYAKTRKMRSHHYLKAVQKIKGVSDVNFRGLRNLDSAIKHMRRIDDKPYRYHKHYTTLPLSDQGAYLQLTYGTTMLSIRPEEVLPLGKYKLRVRAGAVEDAPMYRHILDVGHLGERSGFDGFPITSMQVLGTLSKPEVIETELTFGMGSKPSVGIRERQIGWGHLRKYFYYPSRNKNGYGHEPSIWVDWLELEGPLSNDVPGKLTQLFNKHNKGSDTFKARNILAEFASEAFRIKKPEAAYLQALNNIFKKNITKGQDFKTAIKEPLSIILASPSFIYLQEPGEEGHPRELTHMELAVRLSYFLWSSPPDDELLQLAKEKKLKDSRHLREQVTRMIKDPKTHRFVSGLSHQWLDMKRLDFFQFEPTRHYEFTESTRATSREEVYQTILYLLRSEKEGQIQQLLKSNFVIINGLLAIHYGIDGVEGDHFRKVTLPKKSARGGLLGMAAIHAMGSDGKESSPVERGVWVLRHLLNDPPPPAPANVPQLSRFDTKKMSKKQRLQAHQEAPQCSSCHRKIDPIGYGLENFNATGKWRTSDTHHRSAQNRNGVIDASGAFYKGPAFADFYELRERVLDRQNDFARGFTEALIEYGLGRPFAFTDESLAKKILSSAKKKKYSLSEFIHALVQTDEFKSK